MSEFRGAPLLTQKKNKKPTESSKTCKANLRVREVEDSPGTTRTMKLTKLPRIGGFFLSPTVAQQKSTQPPN